MRSCRGGGGGAEHGAAAAAAAEGGCRARWPEAPALTARWGGRGVVHAVEDGLLSARARGLGPGGAAEGCRV